MSGAIGRKGFFFNFNTLALISNLYDSKWWLLDKDALCIPHEVAIAPFTQFSWLSFHGLKVF
jgi:hypothetical protein